MKLGPVVAQKIVHEAAAPVEPGEKVKAQKHRAHKRLRLVHFGPRGDTMLHEAWYGRAGAETAQTLLDQAIRVGLVRLEYASERTQGDDEFYGAQVAGMRLEPPR